MAEALIRFAVPSGSLQKRTLEILRSAGYNLPTPIGRNDRVGTAGGIEFFIRDRANIASLVSRGAFHAGITGADLVIEEGDAASGAIELLSLPYSRTTNCSIRYVLAVPASCSLEDWERIESRRIGAERVRLAQKCLGLILRRHDVIVPLPGREEAAVSDSLCHAVFVATETRDSLKAHGLKILHDNLFTSSPVLIYHKEVGQQPEQFRLVEQIGLAMRSVLQADRKILVTFNSLRIK